MRILITIFILIIVGGAITWFATRNSTVSISDTFVEGTITIEGEIVCLPHKDTDGPVTLECAYGLRSSDDTFYGLRDEEVPLMPENLTNIPTGTTVEVQGDFLAEPESQYAIEGTVEIDSITVQE